MANESIWTFRGKSQRCAPRWAVLGLALLLVACATPTPYQPAGDKGGGYTDQQIETDRFKVTFEGNLLTDRETVENYLLFRAAEITLEQGRDYFVIVDKAMEETTLVRRDYDYPAYGFYGPHFHPYYHAYHWSHYGYGFGYGIGSGYSREYKRYKAFAEIRIFRGKKPTDNVYAYDAREIIGRLRTRVIRPAPSPAAGPTP